VVLKKVDAAKNVWTASEKGFREKVTYIVRASVGRVRNSTSVTRVTDMVSGLRARIGTSG
jgi:hypothetical protein